jgi:transposase
LRNIFYGPKREEVVGGWRRLHNEELHNSYASSYIIRMINSRRMRWAEHVARMREMRNAYRILVGKPEGDRLLGRPRRIWEDNIRIDVREIGWEKCGLCASG